MVARVSLVLLLSLVLSGLAGCASTPKTVKKIRGIHLSTLRLRRPLGVGADPDVGPGGEDYQSKPRPDAQFDCKTPKEIYAAFNAEAIAECFASIAEPTVLKYELKRRVAPELVLENSDDLPKCVVETLSVIPVPREIFFQSSDLSPLACYSARVDLEADEFLSAKVPNAGLRVELKLPLDQTLEDATELTNFILRLSLRPYFNGKRFEIDARPVPESVCRQCIGEKNVLKNVLEPAPVWP